MNNGTHFTWTNADLRARLTEIGNAACTMDERCKACSAVILGLAIETFRQVIAHFPNMRADSVTLLSSGSLARGEATPASDVDCVLLGHVGDEQLPVLRGLFVDAMDDLGSPNTDCVLVRRDSNCWAFPGDMIDRGIAERGAFAFGSASLCSDFMTNLRAETMSLCDVLLKFALLRMINRRWNESSRCDDRQKPGGRKDLLRADILLEKVAETVSSDRSVDELRARVAGCWPSVIHRAAIIAWRPLCPDIDCGCSGDCIKAADAALQDVATLYGLAEELAVEHLPSTIRVPLRHLRQLHARCEPLPSRDLRHFIHSRLWSILPYAIAIVDTVSGDVVQFARTKLGWYGLLALVANGATSGEVLHSIASLSGYECRNIRDQVLKHPHILPKTVCLLCDSDLRHTHQRAVSLRSMMRLT